MSVVNGTCETAIDVTGLTPYSASVDTAGASPAPVTPSCLSLAGAAVWYRYTNTSTQQALVTVDTSASDYFTGTAVYTGPCGGLAEHQCQVSTLTGLGVVQTFAAQPGETYTILIVDQATLDGGGLVLVIEAVVIPDASILVLRSNSTNGTNHVAAYDHLTGAVLGIDEGNNSAEASGVTGILVDPVSRRIITDLYLAGLQVAWPRLGWQAFAFADGSLVPNAPHTALVWNHLDQAVGLDGGVNSGDLYIGWTGLRVDGVTVGNVLQRLTLGATPAIRQSWVDYSPAALVANAAITMGCTSRDETVFYYGVSPGHTLYAFTFASSVETLFATYGDSSWRPASPLKRAATGVLGMVWAQVSGFTVVATHFVAYDPAGAVLIDIDLSATKILFKCLGFALDGLSVWLLGETALGAATLTRYLLATGAVLQNFALTDPPDDQNDYLDLAVMDAPTPPVGITRYTRRVRRFEGPYADNLWVFLSNLEFLIQSGVGLSTGQGSDPVLMVRLSPDGGQTWGPEFTLSMGKIGEYARRARRAGNLGRARQWVIEVAVSDPIFASFLGCYVNAEVGSS